MSKKNDRAARRRAARAHGGSPPDFWRDYGHVVRILGALALLVVLVSAGLVVRSRQSAQAEIDEYCAVYDQTHDEMAGAISDATSTTSSTTPGTTVPGSAVPGSTVPPATTTTVATTGGSTPGSVPGTSTTVAPKLDVTARVKAVAEKRQAVGPPRIRAAWADLVKILGENKPAASTQTAVQADRAIVSEFAKTECGRDPADF